LIFNLHFPVQLTFHDKTKTSAYNADDIHLGYTIKETERSQPVLNGRFKLEPQIKLTDYDPKAVIDWVEISFHTEKEHQAINIHSYIGKNVTSRSLSKSIFVSGLNRKPRYQGKEFIVRIQEPHPKDLPQIMNAINRHYNLVMESGYLFGIAGIEISMDFYPKRNATYNNDARDLYRWRMTELLRKHLVVDPALFERSYDQPRIIVGTGRYTKPLFSMEPELYKEPTKERVKRLLAIDIPNAMALGKHIKPEIDGTVYFGEKNKEVMIRLMDKTTDRRSGQNAIDLEHIDQRSRIEITFLKREEDRGTRGVLSAIGLNEPYDLYNANFEKLRKLAFDFYIPTVKVVELDGKKKPCGKELKVFERTGAFGLDIYQRAELMKLSADEKGKKTAFGKKGYREAYVALNKQVRRAMHKLQIDWGKHREVMLKEAPMVPKGFKPVTIED